MTTSAVAPNTCCCCLCLRRPDDLLLHTHTHTCAVRLEGQTKRISGPFLSRQSYPSVQLVGYKGLVPGLGNKTAADPRQGLPHVLLPHVSFCMCTKCPFDEEDNPLLPLGAVFLLHSFATVPRIGSQLTFPVTRNMWRSIWQSFSPLGSEKPANRVSCHKSNERLRFLLMHRLSSCCSPLDEKRKRGRRRGMREKERRRA